MRLLISTCDTLMDLPTYSAIRWPSRSQIQAIVSKLRIQIQAHWGLCKEYDQLHRILQWSLSQFSAGNSQGFGRA